MTSQPDNRLVRTYQPWVPAEYRHGNSISPTFTRFITDSRMNAIVRELFALGWTHEVLFDFLTYVTFDFDHQTHAVAGWEGLTRAERAAAAKGIGNACRELERGLRAMGIVARSASGKLHMEGEHLAAELFSTLAGLNPDENDAESEMSAARDALLAIARSTQEWADCFHTGTGRNDETKMLRMAVVVVARELKLYGVRPWARLASTIASVMVGGTDAPSDRAVRRIIQTALVSGQE